MSIQGQQYQNLLIPGYSKGINPLTGQKSNLSVRLNSAGTTLDKVDPVQIGLRSYFSVTAATGVHLDDNGKDWGVTRRVNESDTSYRARILSVWAVFTLGPTPAALKAAVKPFTGYEPSLIERGLSYLKFPLTFPLKFTSNNPSDSFIIDIYVQNPDNVTYIQSDVVLAVKTAKREIATVNIWWNATNYTAVT